MKWMKGKMNRSKEARFLKKRADMWDPKVREKRGGRRWTGEATGDGRRRSKQAQIQSKKKIV